MATFAAHPVPPSGDRQVWTCNEDPVNTDDMTEVFQFPACRSFSTLRSTSFLSIPYNQALHTSFGNASSRALSRTMYSPYTRLGTRSTKPLASFQRSTHRASLCLPRPVRLATQTSTELVRAQDIALNHSSRHNLLCVLTVSECTNLSSVALWGCNEFWLDLVRSAYHDIRQSSAAGYAAFSESWFEREISCKTES